MIMASPNFSMDELTHSDTAARHGIDNTPNDNQKENLYKLAMEMEDVRELLNNKPIYVSSGYRSLALNELLGSKKTSSHIKGLAADFTCRQFGTPNEIVFALINSDIPYDQVILEFDRWVHISFCEDEETPRRQALVINKEGTMLYSG
jgi:zinc D-Ala-D-Ala carboxypeptidase